MKKKFLIALLIIILTIFSSALFYNNEKTKDYLSDSSSKSKSNKEGEDFTLVDLSGKEVSLDDFRGKKVFLNFWATWCGPCKSEMPYINEIYKEDYNIEIITINLMENEKTVKKYIEDNDYKFRVLLDTDGSIGNKYNAQAIPLSVLIDEKGNIIDTYIGSMSKSEIIKFMKLY